MGAVNPRAQRGFTLLELLIVMTVIGALLGTATFAMGPDPERQGRQTLTDLGARLSALREQAVLLDSQYGIALTDTRWQAMALRDGAWAPMKPGGEIEAGLGWRLQVDGQSVLLSATPPGTPQLLALASDELSGFKLHLHRQGNDIGVLRSDGASDPELGP